MIYKKYAFAAILAACLSTFSNYAGTVLLIIENLSGSSIQINGKNKSHGGSSKLKILDKQNSKQVSIGSNTYKFTITKRKNIPILPINGKKRKTIYVRINHSLQITPFFNAPDYSEREGWKFEKIN